MWWIAPEGKYIQKSEPVTSPWKSASPSAKRAWPATARTTGKLLNIKDVRDSNELQCIDPGLSFDPTWDKKTGYCTKQMLVVPVVYDRYLLGIIQLINKKSGGCFNQADQSAVTDISKVLSIAIFKNQKASQAARPSKYQFLITNGFLPEEDINKAIKIATKTGKSTEAVFMSEFKISKNIIGSLLTEYYKTRFVPFNENMIIPGELLKDLKPGFFKTHVFVPISEEGGNIAVAMENPDYLPARDVIKRVIQKKDLEYCVSTREDIFSMIDHFFVGSGKDVIPDSGSIEDILGQLKSEDDDETDETEGVAEDDRAIVQLINKTIIDAYSRKASDIHVEPRPGKKQYRHPVPDRRGVPGISDHSIHLQTGHCLPSENHERSEHRRKTKTSRRQDQVQEICAPEH